MHEGDNINPSAGRDNRSKYEGYDRDWYEARGWLDHDGLLIPVFWRANPAKWMLQALEVRQRWSESDALAQAAKAEREAAKEARKAKQGTRRHGSAFTTKAAKAWGRAQGWKLLDEERSSAYQKGGKWHRRTNDLMIGADLMFEDPTATGIILVQAGGRSERKRHWQRFTERGGLKACLQRGCRFYYVEFDRGVAEPILCEQWAAPLVIE